MWSCPAGLGKRIGEITESKHANLKSSGGAHSSDYIHSECSRVGKCKTAKAELVITLLFVYKKNVS